MTGGASGVAATPAVAPLWRNRDFMVLWTSQVVSTVGTRVSGIAYPLLVLAMTGSPAQAGIVGFAQTLPFLLVFLPAGALVDRWDRRRIMLACEAGRAIALGSVAVATAAEVIGIAQIVVVAFIEGSLFVFFDLAEGAALPRLVESEQLPAAMAQNQARTQGADLVGQPVGGALFGLSRAVPFAFDACSYFVSFAALLSIRRPLQEAHPPARRGVRDEIAEGLRAVLRQPFLRTSILVVAVQNFAFNGLMLVLIVRAQELGAGPALVGAMFACLGAGAIAGAIAAPFVERHLATRVLFAGVAWIYTVEFVVLAAAPNVLALGIVAGMCNAAGPIFNVAFGKIVYRVTPDRLLGRVRSVSKAITWGTIPLGALAAGFLASGVGARGTILVLAAFLAVAAFVTTWSRAMRAIPGE